MSTIDKLALTCRLLYDQRLLELRREIEIIKVKLFFRDYTHTFLLQAMRQLNHANIKCKCSGCKKARRIYTFETEDKEAACTFVPWFENVLHERGLVVLRKDEWEEEDCDGPYDDENDKISEEFTGAYFFSDSDCHLVEKPDNHSDMDYDPGVRWAEICVGKRLWKVESINNPQIRQFERVFGASAQPLSSPP